MTEDAAPRHWRVYGHSICGASHKRAGKPNQDRVKFQPHESGPESVVAAVADGHGARKCLRSGRGAEFAVATALEQLLSYVESDSAGNGRRGVFRRDALVELPQQIVQVWQNRVDADLAADPLVDPELAGLSDAERAVLFADPRSAYGTTLVAVILLPDYLISIQIGDGDLLVVSDSDTEPARPLPPDLRSFANETASLAPPVAVSTGKRPGGDVGPWADFRVRVMPVDAAKPALVLLTTDGYPNAFVNDAAFRKAATDILALARTEGWAFVCEQLPGWLEEASRSGSGDDITVALIIREDVLPEREHTLKTALEGTVAAIPPEGESPSIATPITPSPPEKA